MKKILAAAIIMFASLSASAQVYVSASSGYSFKAVESKMGTKTTLSGVENTYGSVMEREHIHSLEQVISLMTNGELKQQQVIYMAQIKQQCLLRYQDNLMLM
ncbi:hypothetical protein LNI95_09260 [Tenacibaculum dicentrarchi]|nr:hypothetical protein [Tenacibaculum dicentrarchi]